MSWARFHGCDSGTLPDGGDHVDAEEWDAYVNARSRGEVDWVLKYMEETADDDGDDETVLEDGENATDSTVVAAEGCIYGGSATLIIVDRNRSRGMGHDIYHSIDYFDALLNFTVVRAKPLSSELPEDLHSASGDDDTIDYFQTGWCNLATDDADDAEEQSGACDNDCSR